MASLHSADDVMTLLVHLGYLGYDAEREEVFIPNNEIMREFVNATEKGAEWDIVSQAVHRSDDLLQAVWDCDEEKVAAGVAAAHFETSILRYNDAGAKSPPPADFINYSNYRSQLSDRNPACHRAAFEPLNCYTNCVNKPFLWL